MIYDVLQGSEAWNDLRAKRLTATGVGEWFIADSKLTLTKDQIGAELARLGKAYKKSAKVGDLAELLPAEIVEANQGYMVKDLDARHTAMTKLLVAECSSLPTPSWTGNAFTDFGSYYEQEACDAFELETGFTVGKIGFVDLDGFPLFGCSPDRYVYKDGQPIGLLEIKCLPEKHGAMLVSKRIPMEYRMQLHWQMAVCGFDRAWFYGYSPDPQLNDLIIPVEADWLTHKIMRAMPGFDRDYKTFRADHWASVTNLPFEEVAE